LKGHSSRQITRSINHLTAAALRHGAHAASDPLSGTTPALNPLVHHVPGR